MKKLLFVLFLFVLVIIPNKISAYNFMKGDNIEGIHIKEIKPDGWYTAHTASTYIRSDGKLVYCLEHFESISSKYSYDAYYTNVMGLSNWQWERINLLSYYGYGYYNHSDIKWYIITQVMIWRTVNPTHDVYFTNYTNGNRIDIFSNEMSEIENLINNHYKTPSFSKYEFNDTDIISLYDNNGVLNMYDVVSDLTLNKKGNYLNVENKVGEHSIKFTKKDKLYNNIPIIYVSPYSQNVLEAGSYNDVIKNITIKINKTHKFIINKKGYEIDYDDGSIKTVNLENVEFNLYKDNVLINELITDIDGNTEELIVQNGNYCIREIKTEYNHFLDDEEYCFSLTDEVDAYELNLINDLKHGYIYLTKKDIDSKELLEGTVIGIYDLDDNLIYELITNEFGNTIKVPILYGEYYYKELKAPDNYYIDSSDYYFEVDNTLDYNYVLENEKIPFEMPNTGVKENNIILIIVFMIVLILLIKFKKKTIFFVLILLIVGFIFNNKEIKQKTIVHNHKIEGISRKIIDRVNYIHIPKLNIKKEIKFGTTDFILKDNVGILLNGYKFNGGNLVLAGHNNKDTFGYINKLDMGDEVIIHYDSRFYNYCVSDKKVIKVNELEYLYNFDDKDMITLVTCVNNNKDRLLIIGELCYN